MDYTDRGILQQLFVDSLPDCAFILDVRGDVLSWNAGAQVMLGYMEREIVGQHFSCLYSKEDAAAGQPLMALADALKRGRHDNTGRRVHKDGTTLRTQSMMIPLYDLQKKLVAFGSLMNKVDDPTRAANPIARSFESKGTSAPEIETRGKVVVLDDDAALRKVAEDMLTSLGYQVFAMSSGSEALEFLARVDDIDLLFTDVVMPGGMNGGEVAEQARQLRPNLKVLFASGYFEGALIRQGNIESNAQFIGKPYRKKELALTVAKVLNSKVAPH